MQKPVVSSNAQPAEATGPAFAVHYVSGEAAQKLIVKPSAILGMVGYGAGRPALLPASVPFVSVPLLPVEGSRKFEIWTTASPARPHRLGPVFGACGDDLAFGAVELRDDPGVPFEDAVEQAYLRMFDFMDETGFAEPIRFWNYLDRITREDGGLERYRRFNIGRHNAFAARLRQNLPPAASGVGGLGGHSVIYFLAAREAARPVENPRQVSAYQYPAIYGPRSPSFSRAAMVSLAGMQAFLISGTASIVGHETRHCGDLPGQLSETLENLRALIGNFARLAEKTAPETAARQWALKIYLQDPAFRETVDIAINAMFGAEAGRLYLQGEICRTGLLLEIEAFCAGA